MEILIEVIRGKQFLVEPSDFIKCSECGAWTLKVQSWNHHRQEAQVVQVEKDYLQEFYRRNAEAVLVAPDNDAVERALHSRRCPALRRPESEETRPFMGARGKS